MKLKFFNKENSSFRKPGIPTVSFSPAGSVNISKDALELVGLSDGDGIELIFDKEELQWYLMRSLSETAFKPRITNKNMAFNSSLITHKVIENFETSGKSVRAVVSNNVVTEAGHKLYPLLMKPKNQVL